MCKLPSGSTTSAWRTTTRSSRTPRTVSRTQPECSGRRRAASTPRLPASSGPAGGRSAGPAGRTTARSTLNRRGRWSRRSSPRHQSPARPSRAGPRAGRLCCRRTGPPRRSRQSTTPASRGPVRRPRLIPSMRTRSRAGRFSELPAVAATVVRRVPTEPARGTSRPPSTAPIALRPDVSRRVRRRCPPGCGGRTSSPVPTGRQRPGDRSATPVHAEGRHVGRRSRSVPASNARGAPVTVTDRGCPDRSGW